METLTAFAETLRGLIVANPVAQAIGLVAMIACCWSYQGRTPRIIVFRQTIAAMLWTAHMLLLGAWAGGLINFIGGIRNIVYLRVPGGESRTLRSPWPWVFLLLCVGGAAWAGLGQGEGARCLLSMVAQGIACFIYWNAPARTIRALCILASALWLVYDVLAGSIPGTICEIINQISLYVAVWRYRGGRDRSPKDSAA